jgi:hypothetical protein
MSLLATTSCQSASSEDVRSRRDRVPFVDGRGSRAFAMGGEVSRLPIRLQPRVATSSRRCTTLTASCWASRRAYSPDTVATRTSCADFRDTVCSGPRRTWRAWTRVGCSTIGATTNHQCWTLSRGWSSTRGFDGPPQDKWTISRSQRSVRRHAERRCRRSWVHWMVGGVINKTSPLASVVDGVRPVSKDATAAYYTTYNSLMRSGLPAQSKSIDEARYR